MGVVSETVLTITCDNPACPGNSLDPATYDNWIQITASVQGVAPEGGYAFPVQQTAIYCSPACAGTIEDPLQAAEDARNAPPDDPEA